MMLLFRFSNDELYERRHVICARARAWTRLVGVAPNATTDLDVLICRLRHSLNVNANTDTWQGGLLNCMRELGVKTAFLVEGILPRDLRPSDKHLLYIYEVAYLAQERESEDIDQFVDDYLRVKERQMTFGGIDAFTRGLPLGPDEFMALYRTRTVKQVMGMPVKVQRRPT